MGGGAGEDGHRFGGAWTELKLDAVSNYLGFYTKVLRDKPFPDRPFKLWYIDAFAGSGTRRETRMIGGLLDGIPAAAETVDMAGSVLKALDVDPPFERLVFIEGDKRRFSTLESVASEYPHRNIKVIHGEANEQLRLLFSQSPWCYQKKGAGSHRAVVFLDPYGMSVAWSTLELLANTRAVDVWYLFPTGAVNRQLAGSIDRVDEHKRRALNYVFGSDNWRDEIYKTEIVVDLFSERTVVGNKSYDVNQIEAFAKRRLQSIFAYVSDPLPLLNERDSKIFSLFCLSNSSSQKALGLISKGVDHVLKKFGPEASRRKSGH